MAYCCLSVKSIQSSLLQMCCRCEMTETKLVIMIIARVTTWLFFTYVFLFFGFRFLLLIHATHSSIFLSSIDPITKKWLVYHLYYAL